MSEKKTQFGDMFCLRQNPSVVVTVIRVFADGSFRTLWFMVEYIENNSDKLRQMSKEDFDERFMPLSKRDRDWYTKTPRARAIAAARKVLNDLLIEE